MDRGPADRQRAAGGDGLRRHGAERLQFNEDTLWTGGPHDYEHHGAGNICRDSRLLFAGKQKEAEELAMERFMGCRPADGVPAVRRPATEFAGHDGADYRRELDLDTAVATTATVDGATFTRGVFASYPDGAIVVRSADQPGR